MMFYFQNRSQPAKQEPGASKVTIRVKQVLNYLREGHELRSDQLFFSACKGCSKIVSKPILII